MFIREIHLQNFLSFGPEAKPIKLEPLNVIIGASGSGKSNLLEAIDLLRNAPRDITRPIREGGGIDEWTWKGENVGGYASIQMTLKHFNPNLPIDLYYKIYFSEFDQRFGIMDEKIVDLGVVYYDRGKERIEAILLETNGDLSKSVLSFRNNPKDNPEIAYVAKGFSEIKLFRDWIFGRNSPLRKFQRADLSTSSLEPDGSNLGLILNNFQRYPKGKQKLLKELQELYQGIEDYYVEIIGGTVQVYFWEEERKTPATRLSDGTLRYLFLLVILCHPEPPPLVCIENPELGLHPDILPTIARLLKEASERCQLIVTTNSEILVDALSDQPESIIVAEKNEKGTHLKRLSAEEVEPWLKEYRLGQLWTRGQIGGVR